MASETRISGWDTGSTAEEDLAGVPWVISPDDHVVEPPDIWVNRLPKRFLDVGPRLVRMRGRNVHIGELENEWRFEEDVVKEVVAIRAGRREELELFRSDLRDIALALVDDDPPIRFSEARRAIVYGRSETNKLLDEPVVWDGIERVAKVLVRRRYLSPRAVRHLLGDAFFEQISRNYAVSRPRCVSPVEDNSNHVAPFR